MNCFFVNPKISGNSIFAILSKENLIKKKSKNVTDYIINYLFTKTKKTRFIEKAILTVPNARKWTSFEWQSELYIVIACNTKTTSEKEASYSYIYKMKYDEIILFQKLETRTAFGVDTIEIGKKTFHLLYTYNFMFRRLFNYHDFGKTLYER